MSSLWPPCDGWAVRRNKNLTNKLNCISDSVQLLNCECETAIPMHFFGISQVPRQTVLMGYPKNMLLRLWVFSRRGMAWDNSWVKLGLAHLRSCCLSLSHDVRRSFKWVLSPSGWVSCLGNTVTTQPGWTTPSVVCGKATTGVRMTFYSSILLVSSFHASKCLKTKF